MRIWSRGAPLTYFVHPFANKVLHTAGENMMRWRCSDVDDQNLFVHPKTWNLGGDLIRNCALLNIDFSYSKFIIMSGRNAGYRFIEQ